MKMMKTRLTIIILIMIFSCKTFAQGDAKIRPFQFTLFPPISTNGLHAPYTVNHFSINAFVGMAAGVDGVELGGFFNFENEFVKGAQFAGWGNVNAGYIDAVQIAGFVNVNKEGGHGVQGAGFVNYNAGDMEAIEMAGFYNASKNLIGVQAAGFINTAHNVDGVQAAGFVNIANNVEGVQTAGFVNKADDVEGVQVAGFINLARKVKGVQVAGFINVCDSIDGIPVAVISIVRKNGYRKIEVFSDEVFYLNTSFKMGVEKFYTVLTFGMKPEGGNMHYTYGWGVGTNFIFDEKKSLNIEYLFQQLVDNHYSQYAYDHSLNRLKLNFNYRVSSHVGVFAGPSVNFFSYNIRDDNYYDVLPKWRFNLWDGRYNRQDYWFGFNAGLRFL